MTVTDAFDCLSEKRRCLFVDVLLLIIPQVSVTPAFQVLVAVSGQVVSSVLVHPVPNLDIPLVPKIVMWVLAVLCLALQCFWLWMLFAHWSQPTIKASSPRFLVVDVIACLLGVLPVFWLHVNQQAACTASLFIGGAAFAMLFASLAVVSYRINRIFSSTTLEAQRIEDEMLFTLVAVAVVLECIINGVWTGVDPLRAVNTYVDNSQVVFYPACQSENGTMWIAVFIGYKGAILLYVTYLATLTRNVPALFNQARTLASVVYNILLFASLTCVRFITRVSHHGNFEWDAFNQRSA